MEETFPLFSAVLLLLCGFLIICLRRVWWKPESCRIKLKEQGITGPPPSMILGNIPEMKRMVSQISETPKIDGCLTVLPYFQQWTKNYGKLFRFELGGIQLLYVSNLELVKEISRFRSLDLGKPAYLQNERGALLGKGLITANGAVWSHQRKTIAPQLGTEKVKDMVKLMVESGDILVKTWEKIIDSEGEDGIVEIMVDQHMRNFTSYIVSKVIFGNDHHKGIKIFPKCQALINAMGGATTLGIPLSRFLPTKANRTAWKLSEKIHGMIMDISKERIGSTSKDMLQVILEGAENGELWPLTKDEFIADNCKDIFFGGYEPPALAAIWGLMLLASHPEWQARARSEVLEVCEGQQILDYNMLTKMKVLKMVIQEVLRLYPGVALASRHALQEVKIGNVQVPKGVGIWIFLLALHRDPELWGPDADVFNPERFINGVTGACKSAQAYIPFGLGARICPGQNMAMMELTVLFALILSNFNISISPNYLHSPKFGLLLEPEHGVKLLVRKI
ncbi:cytochrome P450 714C2-like isoform X1 [Hevea brasiliensis]|uniref:cytochrome P450 714C2-like isoform X1 n=1 Tax=Hevea brasiliensis TaxID=3981 RepID=UPI0025DFC6D8|nr:cytochrome P450 714C2-like isoform X1 [Hevea brasiliensis]